MESPAGHHSIGRFWRSNTNHYKLNEYADKYLTYDAAGETGRSGLKMYAESMPTSAEPSIECTGQGNMLKEHSSLVRIPCKVNVVCLLLFELNREILTLMYPT